MKPVSPAIPFGCPVRRDAAMASSNKQEDTEATQPARLGARSFVGSTTSTAATTTTTSQGGVDVRRLCDVQLARQATVSQMRRRTWSLSGPVHSRRRNAECHEERRQRQRGPRYTQYGTVFFFACGNRCEASYGRESNTYTRRRETIHITLSHCMHARMHPPLTVERA